MRSDMSMPRHTKQVCLNSYIFDHMNKIFQKDILYHPRIHSISHRHFYLDILERCLSIHLSTSS